MMRAAIALTVLAVLAFIATAVSLTPCPEPHACQK